jgi:hypothetical protein
VVQIVFSHCPLQLLQWRSGFKSNVPEIVWTHTRPDYAFGEKLIKFRFRDFDPDFDFAKFETRKFRFKDCNFVPALPNGLARVKKKLNFTSKKIFAV